MGRGCGLPTLAFLVSASALLPATASAQYFGRQKVQYESFDWQTMQTPKFLIHYYPEEKAITEDAARQAMRWYERHSRTFQHEFDEKPLIFYADHPDFQQTNVIGGLLGEGTGGVTEGLRTRVIMPFTGVYADNDHVLGHELVHVFQYDLAQSPTGGGLAGMSRLPDWLVEGMAEYLSLGRDDPLTAMWLRDAALRGELPSIAQLGRDRRFFPYRYGQALWAYIAGKWGDRSVTEVYRFATRSGVEAALQRVLGVSSGELSQEWITSIRSTYLPLIEGRQRARDAGQPILYDDEIGAMNLSPALSPDGRFVAFFGRRDIFTVELLLADAETGEVVKKLTSPNRDSHYDAISFISSAGAWSPDGTKFAFIVFSDGDSQIAIMDVGSRNVERRISAPGIGSVSNPTWSPDGRTLVFSGIKGGISDLYALDMASGDVRQLTDDKYGDLQPTFSPDGTTIAFVSDRDAKTDFTTLTYGPMHIALMDVATNRVRVLDIFPGVKHINPQYAPDGQSIYFISDRGGFNDIYRYSLSDGSVYQVTRLATGVSGITALSPALTVAGTGRLMFSAFENSGNNIYAMDCSTACGTPVTPNTGVADAGILPPLSAEGSGLVTSYLADPLTGLPSVDVAYETQQYHPKIALDYLGPPSFGVGVSDYGTQLGGGVSAFFGDMLGNHMLGVAVQANGTLKDIGGQAVYQNASNRINWGVGVGHIPYLTGITYISQDPTTGNQTVNQFLDRIFIDQVALNTFYPFSQTRRFEVSGGFTRYGFNREINRIEFNRFGQQIGNVERIDTTAPDPLHFFQGSAALVGDNSYFGFTSPIVGQRYRVEVSPTFGTLQYQTLLLDYRKYLFARPFTFAFRGFHYGRYGQDAGGVGKDGTRVLSPLYLGYETFLRGYARESFDTAECHPTSTSGCPAFDRLIGSRVAVANLELRIPLIGTEQLGLLNFPFLPTEIAPFIDAGMAWSSGDDVKFEFVRNTAERVPVISTGVSARFNVLGYLVFEAYYAYPFQRPDKGAHFGFQLAPGW